MSKQTKRAKQEVKVKDAQRMRSLSVADLKKELIDFTKDDFKLRMQKATGQLVKPHLIKQVRRRLARVKTTLTEKNRLAAIGI